jgi:hypothetical protein
MIPSRDPRVNLAILDAMVGELERYLASSDLSHRVVYELSGRRHAATLTIGTMVAVTHALEQTASQLGKIDARLLAILVEQQAAIRMANRDAYRAKLSRELKSHLDSWSWFLDDCERRERSCREDYAAEVWLRTRIGELFEHASDCGFDVAASRSRCSVLDDTLKGVLVDGPFLGPEGEESAFPEATFWWLYGRPE